MCLTVPVTKTLTPVTGRRVTKYEKFAAYIFILLVIDACATDARIMSGRKSKRR